MRIERACRRRSPPRRPPDIRCHRRVSSCGRIARCPSRTDQGLRSTDAPRRAPASRKPGCLSPPRHAKESFSRRDCSLRPSRRLSRSRRPHLVPNIGESVFDRALQGHGAVTRGSVTFREYRRLFNSLGPPRLGLTTQARHRARPTRPSTRSDCLARTDAGRSA
jgi:hypothetical protein